MKKLLSFIFVCLLSITLFGCGEEPTPTPGPDDDPKPVEVTKYTVTFVANGETLKTEEVESGKAATAPTVNVEGYTFEGWDKDFSNVTSNLTVNAKLTKIEAKKYTVKFLVDGNEVASQEVEEGKAATAPQNPTKEGFNFKGWDKDFSKVTSDLEVNAIFEEIPDTSTYYTVEFVVNGVTINTQQVKEGEAAVLPEQPAPVDGKYFAGWRKDTSKVTSDMKVNAIMTEVNLEAKTVYMALPIGKCELTYYVTQDKMSNKIYDGNLNTTKIYFCEGYPSGTTYWQRILISAINGELVVTEIRISGGSDAKANCDYAIFSYGDLKNKLINLNVQPGDIIQFTTNPSSFFECQDTNESFTVKRYQDVTQYDLSSDVAHTVIALHKMDQYFKGLGDVIKQETLDLVTLDPDTEAAITWVSSNPEIISNDGLVNLPDAETEVTLTATAVYGTSTYTWVYTLKVSK